MASLSKIGTTTLGPYAPSQFVAGDTNALIQAGIQAITGASSTSSIKDTEIFQVLGNYYVLVTYQLA